MEFIVSRQSEVETRNLSYMCADHDMTIEDLREKLNVRSNVMAYWDTHGIRKQTRESGIQVPSYDQKVVMAEIFNTDWMEVSNVVTGWKVFTDEEREAENRKARDFDSG